MSTDLSAHAEAWGRTHGNAAEPGRRRALEFFLDRGFPGIHEEDWRYTNLDPVRERSAAWLAGTAGADVPATATAMAGWNGLDLRLVDGQPSDELPALPDGLTARWVPAEAAALPGDDGPDGQAVLAWNRAFLDQALTLATAPGAGIAQPLRLAFASSGAPVAAHARVLLDLAPGSSLAVFLHTPPGTPALASRAIRIRVGAGAKLRLIRLQDAGTDVLQLEWTRICVERDGQVELATLDTGGRLVRHDLQVSLEGPGASAKLAGLFMATGQQHVDNHVRVDHRAPRTTSDEVFRGILDGAGRGVFNGRIVVHPGAAGSNAALTNRNLLLSKTAEVDTKPELEISVDDVKCSHGATTGQLDAAALFYLQSRGIDFETARGLLVDAFGAEIVNRVPDVEARALVAAAVAARRSPVAPAVEV